jgi:hypothetical protein
MIKLRSNIRKGSDKHRKYRGATAPAPGTPRGILHLIQL